MGCEGPRGVPGQDVAGVDIVSPSIEMLKPHPLSVVWDEFEIAASAVDNVAVREVVFSVDGSSVVNGILLLDDRAPYQFIIEALEDSIRHFDVGWHFIAARAYDIAGNYTDTPPIPIRINYSDDLEGLVELSFHNGEPDTNWTLPGIENILHYRWEKYPSEDDPDVEIDTLMIDTLMVPPARAYWARFNTPIECQLLSVSAMLGGVHSDTTSFTFTMGIWEGTVFPEKEKKIATYTLSSDSLEIEPDTLTIDLRADSLSVSDDFFVVLEYLAENQTDSLVLAADDGLPPRKRSGCIDDDGIHTLNERYSVGNNFIISCTLFYEGGE